MLSLFECITRSSPLSVEEIKLFVIVNWVFNVSDFLRLFMISFKYGLMLLRWGSEFLGYEIELRNRVTQNDVTLRATNSKSKNKKLHFELLTRRFNFYFSTFELLSRSWKIKTCA